MGDHTLIVHNAGCNVFTTQVWPGALVRIVVQRNLYPQQSHGLCSNHHNRRQPQEEHQHGHRHMDEHTDRAVCVVHAKYILVHGAAHGRPHPLGTKTSGPTIGPCLGDGVNPLASLALWIWCAWTGHVHTFMHEPAMPQRWPGVVCVSVRHNCQHSVLAREVEPSDTSLGRYETCGGQQHMCGDWLLRCDMRPTAPSGNAASNT